MDNLTHSLTGLALARAGLDRLSPRATLLLLFSANIPDIDIVALARSPLTYVEIHRGYTHSLLFLPLMGAVCVAVVAALYRERLPWLKTWLVCCMGVASHLLLDWTNSYGIRLLIPFSSRWFHLDLNGLFDAWILAILILGILWPHFSRLVSSEIGSRSAPGRTHAIVALAFFALFDVGRALLHQRAIAQLEARLYEGAPPITVAALPQSFNPFRWRGIVETADVYRVMPLDALRQLDTDAATIFYKPATSPALERAKQTEAFRYFLYFARFPVWSIEPVTLPQGQGRRVDLADLRFGRPGAGSFHCVALEDEHGILLDSQFTYGPGTDLGRVETHR
jgi:inner membrane protein